MRDDQKSEFPPGKWRCPSCKKWVQEEIGKTCQACKPELFPNLVREGS